MNKAQRKRLQDALDILTSIQEEEQEKYDNMYEYFPDSEQTEKLQENADTLQEAVDLIEQVMEGY